MERKRLKLEGTFKSALRIDSSQLLDVWMENKDEHDPALRVFAEWVFSRWALRHSQLSYMHEENRKQARLCEAWLAHRAEAELEPVFMIDLELQESEEDFGEWNSETT